MTHISLWHNNIPVHVPIGIPIANKRRMKQIILSTELTGHSEKAAGQWEGKMPQRYLRGTIGSCFLAISLIWAGCSSGGNITINSSNDITSSVENFFPVEAGSIREYSISNPNGTIDTVSFEIGSTVPFGSKLTKEWIAVDQFGVKSTSLVTISPSAIVFYETPNAPGETILALPLEAGASWLRYGESSDDSEIGDSFGGLITNLNGKGEPADADSTVDGKSGDPIDAGKNFPIDGSETLIVDGFEKVLLSNGEVYSDAVKLRNGGLGGVNYYWFAPGTGLVKFVLRGQTDGSEVGATVGELISLTLQ